MIALDLNAGAVTLALGLLSLLLPVTTRISGVMLAFPVLFGIVTCVLTITSLLGVFVSARVFFAILLVTFAILCELRSPVMPRTLFSTCDLWALATAGLIFLVFYWPFIGKSTGQTLALLSQTTDAGTHLSIARAVMREGGYVTLVPGASESLLGGSQGYPPGLSGNLGTLMQMFAGPDPTISNFVGASTPLLIGSYAMLSWLATWLALHLVGAVTGRLTTLSALSTATASGLSFTLGYAVLLIRGASYAQIAATALTLAFLTVVVMNRADARLSVTLALSALSVGVAHSWYLLTPLLAIPWIVHLSRNRYRRKARLALLTAILPFLLFPLIQGPDPIKQVGMAGYAAVPSVTGLLIVLALATWSMYFLIARQKGARFDRLLLVSSLISALVLLIGVGLLQVRTGGQVSYYSAKLFYSFLVFVAVAGSAATGILFRHRSISYLQLHPAMRLGAACLSLFPLAGAASGILTMPSMIAPFLRGESATQNSSLLQAAFDAHPRGIPQDSDVWIVDGCGRGANNISNKWLYDLSLGWNSDRERAIVEFINRRNDDWSPVLRRASDPKVRAITLYVGKPCRGDGISEILNEPKVRVVNVS